MPTGELLQLSDDKSFCMEEMKRSMQNNLEETAWPKTQYLWKLHPLLTWINDKAGLLYGRGQAPVISIPDKLSQDEVIFIVTGSYPNAKAASLVDEWFGIVYRNGIFAEILPMHSVVQKVQLGRNKIPNANAITEEHLAFLSGLREDVIDQAKKHLASFRDAYKKHITPLLDAEVDKLGELEARHKDYQLSLFQDLRKRSEKVREVDELFDRFVKWVHDTMEIQKDTPPYIRIVTVMMGV